MSTRKNQPEMGNPQGCRTTTTGGCGTVREDEKLETLSDVVRHYQRNYWETVDYSRKAWMGTSFDQAVEEAGKARGVPGGKHHDHLRTLRTSSLRKGAERLQAMKSDIFAAETFEDLHSIVQKISDEIYGLSEMWAYDTALHIGLSLGRQPRYVYLHRGARVGAERLTGHKFSKTERLSPEQLPRPLSELPADEVEDCLCIYKDTPAFRQALSEGFTS